MDSRAKKRKRLTIAEALQHYRDLRHIRCCVTSISLTNEEFLGFCFEAGLTVYDSLYLALARREDLPIATLDNEMIEAARRLNIPIFEV